MDQFHWRIGVAPVRMRQAHGLRRSPIGLHLRPTPARQPCVRAQGPCAVRIAGRRSAAPAGIGAPNPRALPRLHAPVLAGAAPPEISQDRPLLQSSNPPDIGDSRARARLFSRGVERGGRVAGRESHGDYPLLLCSPGRHQRRRASHTANDAISVRSVPCAGQVSRLSRCVSNSAVALVPIIRERPAFQAASR